MKRIEKLAMNRLKTPLLCAVLYTSITQAPVQAQSTPEQFWQDAQTAGRSEKSAAAQTKMQWWRAARFGMFVQLHPANLLAAEASWSKDFTAGDSLLNQRPSLGATARETQRWWDGILPKVAPAIYDNLYRSFYPGMFEATQWMTFAKNSGMKYVMAVAKHHDGFCFWDSKHTEYDIKNTPFKRDLIAELASAAEKAGMPFGLYFSQRDWPHANDAARHNRILHAQIEELLKKYKNISMLYFDAENYPPEAWETEQLFKKIAKLRPEIIINNRCGVPADYDTPQERVGDFPADRDWEARMNFNKRAWRAGFDQEILSHKELVAKLVQCAGNDGNLLLNVNPLPTGQVDPPHEQRLRETGEWLRQYGESIYGTRGGPFLAGRWGASTFRDSTIYLHVLNWSEMPERLPGFKAKIVASTLLTGGEIAVEQTNDSLHFHVAEKFRNNFDTIIKLKIDRAVAERTLLRVVPRPQTANPQAGAKARELLDYLHGLSGRKILTGQHNFIGRLSQSSDRVAALTGKYPALWGSDFGFADSTWDHDNIKYRAQLVDEIKKQHGHGAIITFTYHQANPKIGEPCPWMGGVNGTKLSNAEWDSLLTSGTSLNHAYLKQMDIIAGYLKELRDADIPILWRPYHEMNGAWFWWGKKTEPHGFISMWRMLFDYYSNHHQLDNLIWVWSPDKPWHGLEEYYPGDDYVDVLSVDIYPHPGYPVVFRQEWYQRVLQLAKGKPIAIGENGALPVPEELDTQPRWVWFMSWADLLERQNSPADIINLYNAYQTLTRDEVQFKTH